MMIKLSFKKKKKIINNNNLETFMKKLNSNSNHNSNTNKNHINKARKLHFQINKCKFPWKQTKIK